jgi:hypothetical protein
LFKYQDTRKKLVLDPERLKRRLAVGTRRLGTQLKPFAFGRVFGIIVNLPRLS